MTLLECHLACLVHDVQQQSVGFDCVVKSLSADSDNDTSLALNIITDYCPELTKKQSAHNEWVRLNCQGEKGAVWSVALADRASRTGNVPKTNLCWAGLRHQRFELMWTPRGRAECFLESRSMEKCAQSMLLLLNLPALFAPGNLDILSTNTSYKHQVQT